MEKKSGYVSHDPKTMWLNEVPKIITPEKIMELHRQYSSRYIIYRRRKWGAECYCTYCLKYYHARKDIPIDTPLDGELNDLTNTLYGGRKVKCPYCGQYATAKSAGRSRRKMYERHNVTVFKASEDGETVYGICGSLFPQFYRVSPEEPKDIHINPVFEDYYVFQMRRGDVKMVKWDFYDQGYVECKSPAEPFVGYWYCIQRFGELTNPEELNKSFLRYCMPHYLPHLFYKTHKPIALLQIIAKYPQAEMLIKTGFAELLINIAEDVPYKRTINLNGKTPAEIFKTDPNRAAEIMRQFRIYDCGHYSNCYMLEKIKFFKCISKIDPKIKFEFSAMLYDKYIKYDYMTFGHRSRSTELIRRDIIKILSLTNLSPTKFDNYVNRQLESDPAECCHAAYFLKPTVARVCHSYIDYIWQCRDLGYDLSDSQVNRPKDLEAAHRRTSDAIRAIEAEKAARTEAESREAYQARYKELCEKYAYVGEEYLIVVPEGPADIVAEGTAQHNCVAGYAQRHIEGKTTILFLRHVSAPAHSFGTLEVKEDFSGKAYFVQAYAERNKQLPEDATKFLDDWLKAVNSKKKSNKKAKTA